MQSTTETRCSHCCVDVVDGERSQFADRCGVQQREQSDERFVWVAVAAGPAAHESRLVGPGERFAAETARGSVCETGGRVRETDPLLAGEVEEVTQRREPESAVTAGREERFDVRA